MTKTKQKTQGTSLFEEDCDRPACDDIKNALPSSLQDLEAMSKKHAASRKVQCPPRSAEIGRSSWNLLHSMAAWYPDQPTPEQGEKMTNFMSALAEFYPCTWCAKDFQDNLKQKPVKYVKQKSMQAPGGVCPNFSNKLFRLNPV
jgi:hypothetical protein